ncbi:MAG: dephospho-CoA kinase, partial [Lachnospiraceae bacterium]|nr:dephospho-CoA kinase [Lachnospiraceae bacterium]
DYYFFEAALLIECEYDKICDEIWYIFTTQDNRRARLKSSRGYSDERVDEIFASQLDEEVFRMKSDFVIDNNRSLDYTFEQIDKRLTDRGDL